MIVKLLTRHHPSYASLIDYIMKEGKESQVFTHNLRSKNKGGWVKEFIKNESFREHQRKNQVYLYHEIISFSNKELKSVMTDKMLSDIAKKYFSLRGGEGIYVGAVHKEKDHVHIHFCTSGLEYRTGKALRLSRSDLQQLKVKLQAYQLKKYPELSKSVCEHGKGKPYLTNSEWQKKTQNKRNLMKEELKEKVEACFAKAKTQNEFLSLLRDADLHHYERNGVPTGITYDNLKFRFSKLNLSKEKLEKLPLGRSIEEKALAAIRQIRNKHNLKLNTMGKSFKGQAERELKEIRKIREKSKEERDKEFQDSFNDGYNLAKNDPKLLDVIISELKPEECERRDGILWGQWYSQNEHLNEEKTPDVPMNQWALDEFQSIRNCKEDKDHDLEFDE